MRCDRCWRRGTLLTREAPSEPLRIWALLGARAGDNNQVIALAEALGQPFEIKQLHYNRLRVLGPMLLGRSLASLTPSSKELVTSEPPPDLTISAGHRSVPVVQWLRDRSNGRARSIHVGFPRISPGNFDLVIATTQYPIPDHPRLLRLPFALTRAATTAADPVDEHQLAELPRPRRLLIVGGPNLYWELDEARLLGTLAAMMAESADRGGSILVTTSPRTPAGVRADINRALESSKVPSILAAPGTAPRYQSLLAAADSIRITADSVAMISDAIWTGKPIGLVSIRPSSLGELAIGLMDRLRPRQPLYPQDLRPFWDGLAEIGIGERLGIPNTSAADQMRVIVERASRVVEDAAERQEGREARPRPQLSDGKNRAERS